MFLFLEKWHLHLAGFFVIFKIGFLQLSLLENHQHLLFVPEIKAELFKVRGCKKADVIYRCWRLEVQANRMKPSSGMICLAALIDFHHVHVPL